MGRAFLLLVIALGLTATLPQRIAWPDEVMRIHARSLMTNEITQVASADSHTVKPWFAGKVEFAPPVAKLDSIGFPLLGGRVDTLDNQKVAVLIYMRRKHLVSVFVSPGPVIT